MALSGIIKGGIKTAGSLALPLSFTDAGPGGPSPPWQLRAPRVSMIAVETGDFKNCLLNPNGLRERYQMRYDDLAPLGSDHEIGQYRNTASANIPIQLAFDRAIIAKRLNQNEPDIDSWRNFLYQFTAPLVEDDEFTTGGPPQMLLIWPNVLTIRAQVRSLEFDYQRFSIDDLRLLTYTASLELKEARTGLWSSEQMRTAGGVRESQPEDAGGIGFEPQIVL